VIVALMVVRGGTSRTGWAIIGCCLASAAWAAATDAAAILPTGLPPVFDSIRLSAWLLFAAALVTGHGGDGSGVGRRYLIVAAVFCAFAVAIDMRTLILRGIDLWEVYAQPLVRVGFGVFGLLTIENLWRNSEPARRWQAWPLCLGLGLLYAYELFLFSDAFITRGRVDPGLALGRPIAAACLAPLLALAMVRNREWRIDIHVSREVVLHTATLLASGCFLLAVAIVAVVLRRLGGDWGLVLQLAMLFGSVVVLATVLTSGSFRQRLKFLISRNFFSHRYDYRVEWLKFINLVSEPRLADELQVRIIRALAEFVASPAGMLWSLCPGLGYCPTAAWQVRGEAGARVASDQSFVAGFRGGSWIQERSRDAAAEGWPFASPRAWLAVPLTHRRELVGFVVLDRPSHAIGLDWEAFELLRAAGSQAASYLAEERSTKGLREAELLTEYSKRFAFVVHDIKNMASQLGLVVSNARHYIDDPEFQRDMLQTVEDAVARMNHLLGELKSDPVKRPAALRDPGAVVATVATDFAAGSVIVETGADGGDQIVSIAPDRLRSAVTHLVQNALDASPPGDAVRVSARRQDERFIVDVVDHGAGMDETFIRDGLFLPFRSTKSGGYGIGAYQTRELIRAAGGELEVTSRQGVGTTMRIVLPLIREREPVEPSILG
jgi:putative PEP-CTERM system histidine kinase